MDGYAVHEGAGGLPFAFSSERWVDHEGDGLRRWEARRHRRGTWSQAAYVSEGDRLTVERACWGSVVLGATCTVTGILLSPFGVPPFAGATAEK